MFRSSGAELGETAVGALDEDRGDLALSASRARRRGALGSAPRAELLHVLTLPDYDRAGRIGEFYANPKTRTFAELLVDAEEHPYLRAVLVGMLREDERGD